jgi:tRNA G18 (ribose-2'-O)-methylase SpoU
MLGTLDSMNVSVAAAILLFEATRQRDFYRDVKGI